MTSTFKIEGMTCNGCRTAVEEAISSIEGVESASVNLETGVATLQSNNQFTPNALQAHLSPKYTVLEIKRDHGFQLEQIKSDEPPSKTTKLEQLKPLFLILVYITTASILMHFKEWNTRAFMLDFMGLFLIVFSFFKLLDLKGFPESFKMYDPLAKKFSFYANVYPFIEVALGLMFLLRIEVNIAIVITLILLSITTIGVLKSLLNKRAIRCACLGTALNLPMTEATFIENAIMILMGLTMLVTG